MNAIILAAGMGTRLRPLTNDRPKCLVEVNGIPMVERQIQFLKEKGIDDITLISGYKAEALDFLKEIASSRISTGGFDTAALAIARSCLCPCERLLPSE